MGVILRHGVEGCEKSLFGLARGGDGAFPPSGVGKVEKFWGELRGAGPQSISEVEGVSQACPDGISCSANEVMIWRAQAHGNSISEFRILVQV